MALSRRCPGAGLMHHSDQGSPYASEDYQRVLESHGIACGICTQPPEQHEDHQRSPAVQSRFAPQMLQHGARPLDLSQVAILLE